MSLKNYTHFQEYIVRTPLFSVSLYLELLQNYSRKALFEFVENPTLKSAILHASPDLWNEFSRYKQNQKSFSEEKIHNLEIALLKYSARIASRATPFGLFAGCALGNFSNETKIILENSENHKLQSQLDMQFEITLIQDFLVDKEVRNLLLYVPNNSLYEVGDFYRYVEYHYENLKRNHVISAIRKNEIITLLLEKAKQGLKINELVKNQLQLGN